VELAWTAGSRWHVEEALQQADNEAGLDPYQVRGRRAWYAHITLSMLAPAWLAASKAIAAKGDSATVTANHIWSWSTWRRHRQHQARLSHYRRCQVVADNGFHVMAYDVPSRLPYDQGQNSFFVSLRGETVEEVTGHWEKLSDGASIVQPLGPAGWAPVYGMLKDRFGVVWVVDVVSEYNG
jgi:uncharacterized glyoxalase superfamily protein PhnB